MAGLLDLFGGGGSDPMDIYGDLFTEKQRAALRDQQMTQGLLNAAAVFSKAGQASRLPVSIPWGEAAQALGGSGDEAMNRMLKGMQVAEEVRSSRQKRGFADQVAKFAQGLLDQEKQLGLPQGTLVKPYLAATGGATSGPVVSNAPPPPPPVGSNTSDYGGTSGGPGVGGDPDLGLPPSPAKAAGLLNPAVYGGGGLPGQGVLASLGGGGAGVPLPFGQGSPGSPDLSNIKIEQLGSTAMPVEAPFPTLANPNKPRSAWEQGTRYDRGDTPFAPARPYATPQQFAAPPSELDRLSQLMKVQTVGAPAASNLTGSAWEIANNNLGGMRRPGVNATPSQGGFQTFATPEAGLGAISNQLDRYVSGATTGKPLSTIREIVSTWAPPSENDTEALIKRASRVMGVADNIPLNLSDPAVKAKLIEATIRNEQGGNLPVDPALIARVANAPAGTYAASTGGGSGFSGRIEQLGGEAAPAGTTGTIPGLNISPQGLAALNMLSKLGGLGSPFESLLETYYKSPGYLGEAATAQERARTDVQLEMGPKIKAAETIAELKAQMELKPKLEAAIEQARIDPKLSYDEKKALIERESKRLEQLQAAMTTSRDVVVTPPGGQPRKIPLTNEQILRLSQGKPLPEIGLPAMSAVQLGEEVLTKQQEVDITSRGAAQTEMYKAGQKALDTAHDAVRGANQRTPYYGSMLTAMQGFQPGATAEMRLTGMQYLRDAGVIKGDNVPQGEALRLAGERLAFLAVPPNQGSWSNIERQSLKSSIPTMALTPEGLTDAIKLMQQLDDYDRKVSEIHRKVADENKGLPNLLEAQRRVEALGSPLTAQQEAALETLRQGAATPGVSGPPAGGPPATGAIKTPYGTITPVR